MEIEALPQDSFREIFKYLSQKEILNLRFIFRAAKDFVREKVEKYKHSNVNDFKDLIQNGEYIAIKYLLFESRKNKKILNNCLEWACKKGDEDLIALMIEKGANDWNQGLEGACYGGKMDPALSMIEKGAHKWGWGLHAACYGGNMDLALLMIEKGANTWNECFYAVCYGGNMDLTLLMIEKGANNWNWGLVGACEGRNKELVLLMIKKGADNWNLTFEGTKLKDHKIFSLFKL